MVLQGQLCGRVGRYRGFFRQPASDDAGCLLFRPRPEDWLFGRPRRGRQAALTVPSRSSGRSDGPHPIDRLAGGAGVRRGRPLGAGGGAPLGRAQTVLARVTPPRRSTDRSSANTEIAPGRCATARGPGGTRTWRRGTIPRWPWRLCHRARARGLAPTIPTRSSVSDDPHPIPTIPTRSSGSRMSTRSSGS